MSPRQVIWTISLWAITLPGGVKAESETPFTTILRKHWKDWSGDSGAITPAQLDHLMKRRKITGQPAAVLAAMKMQQRNSKTKELVTWTMPHVETYESLVAQHPHDNSYDRAYKKALAAIEADPHQLYVDGALI